MGNNLVVMDKKNKKQYSHKGSAGEDFLKCEFKDDQTEEARTNEDPYEEIVNTASQKQNGKNIGNSVLFNDCGYDEGSSENSS